METKVTILDSEIPKPKKSIQFVKFLTSEGEMHDCDSRHNPSSAEEIILIKKGYASDSNNMDLMFARHAIPSHSVLYLGHFNDGIV